MTQRVPLQPMAASGRADADLVGRRHELERLHLHWQRACAGQRESVLVSGEPGIGKTTLVRHFAAQLGDDALVLCAPGRRAAEVPPLWPWITLARELLAACPESLPAAAHVLDAVAPWIPGIAPRQAALNAALRSTRFLLIDGLAQLVRETAERKRVCVWLEDLQDYDPDSLEVVQELLQRAAAGGVLLIGTCRVAELMSAEHALGSTLQRFERSISLHGLRADEIAELMAATLRRPVGLALAQRVRSRADGNPLYVRAVLSVLDGMPRPELGSVDVEQIRLPESLRRAGSCQLQALSQACRDVLSFAAVLGREFELQTVADMAGASASALSLLMQEAARAGVVSFDPQLRGRYRFTHALLHEWLRDELAPAALARAHVLAAGALLRRGEGARDLRRLYSAANHWLCAGDRRSLESAADAAQRAGESARERGADAESIESFKVVVSALRQQLAADGGERRLPLRAALAAGLLDLAEAQWRAGEQPAALSGLLELASLACELQDAELLVRAALVTLDNRNVHLSPEQQLLCDRARERLSDVSPALRVRLLASLGAQQCLAMDSAAGARLTVQAEAAAVSGEVTDPQAQLALLNAQLLASNSAAGHEARRGLVERYCAHAAAHGDHFAVAWGQTASLHLALGAADAENLARCERELERSARALGSRFRWDYDANRWALAFMRGQFSEARRLLDALAPEDEHAGSSVPVVHLSATLALARVTAQPAQVLEAFSAASEELLRIPVFAAVRVAMLADVGELDQARIELTRIPADAWSSAYGQCCLAQAARELNDVAWAQTLYAALLPAASRFSVLPGGLISQGPVAHYLGLAAATCGLDEEAIAQLQAAIACSQRMGAMPALARSHYELARALRDARQPARAVEHAQLAQQLAATLGMPWLGTRAETLLRELAAGAPESPRRDARPHNVWRRDGELWCVSFGGHSVRLVDRKGLDYVAQLLARPNEALHVLELVAAQSGAAAAHGGEHDASLSQRGVLEGYEQALDARSLVAYRLRLTGLQGELDEAVARADLGRCQRLQAERELLLHELSSGGRLRSRPVERARKAVYNRVRESIRLIESLHPSLARHLERSVRTGVYCSYRPEHDVRWAL